MRYFIFTFLSFLIAIALFSVANIVVVPSEAPPVDILKGGKMIRQGNLFYLVTPTADVWQVNGENDSEFVSWWDQYANQGAQAPYDITSTLERDSPYNLVTKDTNKVFPLVKIEPYYLKNLALEKWGRFHFLSFEDNVIRLESIPNLDSTLKNAKEQYWRVLENNSSINPSLWRRGDPVIILRVISFTSQGGVIVGDLLFHFDTDNQALDWLKDFSTGHPQKTGIWAVLISSN